jgi:23S rRNA (adenine2503-C2)-methyltransferase
MDLKQLQKSLAAEPAYRLKQAYQAIFIQLIDSWTAATNFSQAWRQKLNDECPLAISAKLYFSQDKRTVKALMTLVDGLKIECVLMRHADDRNTVCVSSQVGCPLGCLFCATGKMGFKRNLTSEEIIDQVLLFARYLKKEEAKITNVVFMGMGEPFLNYLNVLSAIKILNDPDGFNLGARHFSISTAGIIEGIKKLATEKLQVNLAISLHAPNNQLRSKIMPVNKKYSLEKIISAVDDYIQKTNRRVMFEYLMIKGVNDSEVEALELVEKFKKPLYMINLVVYNPTGQYQPSPSSQTKKFKEFLQKNHLAVTQRFSFGQEIKAACGQLATDNS